MNNSIKTDSLSNNKGIIGNLALRILLLTLPFIQLSKIYKQPKLESALFSLTFILLFVCIFALFQKNMQISKPFTLGILIIVFVITAALYSSIIYPNVSLHISYFNRAIIFISTVLFILFILNYPLDKKIEALVYRISILQSLIFIVAFFTNRTYPFGALSSITFGFSNPNFAGMWLLNLICINVIYIYKKALSKSYYYTLLVLAITAFNVYFLFITDNRSSLLGVVFLFFGLFINFKRKRYYHLHPLLITSLPVIIVVVYIILVKTGAINIFSALTDVGKTLTSRVEIWNEGIETIIKSPIFGSYYDVLYNLSNSQIHNIFLDTAANYGIFTTIFFFSFLYYGLKSISSKIKSKKQNIAYWGFSVIMLVSSFEASLVSGSTGMYIMSCVLLALALKEPEEESRKQD